MRERYERDVLPALIGKFGYSTPMQAPRLVKVTLNMGVGEAKQDAKQLEAAQGQLARSPASSRACGAPASRSPPSKSVRGCRSASPSPCDGARMWEFLDRLFAIAVPRIRDFRGLNPRSFDGRGNYSMGVREQLIFPEIDYDSIDQIRGLDVTITTTAKSDVEAFELLLGLGMPFAKEGRPGGAEDAEAEAEAEAERRKEEARERAAAEQAALEQLKEENPEAYAKPEKQEAEEGGEDAESPTDEENQEDGYNFEQGSTEPQTQIQVPGL